MATDYDAPRTADTDQQPEPALQALAGAQPRAADPDGDADPTELELDLPDADLSDEQLIVSVQPRQADEFTCTSCYLVHHNSRLADPKRLVCTDCAA